MGIHRVGFGLAADVRVAPAGTEGAWAGRKVGSAAHGEDASAIVTVAPDTPCSDADDRAREHGVRHLFVVDGGKLVGVMCRCDLYPEPEANEDVATRMSSHVYALDRSSTLAEAAAAMKTLGVGFLPVVDRDRPVGLVTRGDSAPRRRARAGARRAPLPRVRQRARRAARCAQRPRVLPRLHRSLHGARQRLRRGRLTPFRRGRFVELPETPRRPHRFFELPERRVTVASSAFGNVGIHVREPGAGAAAAPRARPHDHVSYSWRYVMEPLAASQSSRDRARPARLRPQRQARRRALLRARRWRRSSSSSSTRSACAAAPRSATRWAATCACARRSPTPARSVALVDIHSPGVPDWRYRALGRALLGMPGMRAMLSWWVRRAPQRWAHKNVHYFDESLKSLEEAGEYGDPLADADGAARVHQLPRRHLRARATSPRFVAALAARRDAGQPFPVPLLLLYSRRDPLVPPRVGEALHALVPVAPLEWVEDTSHFAHVDTPEPVVRALAAFFR